MSRFRKNYFFNTPDDRETEFLKDFLSIAIQILLKLRVGLREKSGLCHIYLSYKFALLLRNFLSMSGIVFFIFLHKKDILICSIQIEKLLALVKNEQKIYNIIFHEVIRQVSVECIERDQLLAELRNRYAHMLDRIPKQVKRCIFIIFSNCFSIIFNFIINIIL